MCKAVLARWDAYLQNTLQVVAWRNDRPGRLGLSFRSDGREPALIGSDILDQSLTVSKVIDGEAQPLEHGDI